MTRSRFPDGFRILKGQQEYVTYIEHSSLRVWYSDVPYQYESHYHSAVEIIMPIRGEVLYTVADFSYRVQADEVLIIPPNWEHGLTMQEGSARYLLLFEPDNIFTMRDMKLIEGLLRIPIYLTEQPEAQDAVRALLMQIVNCYEKKEFLWNSICYSYLLQIYAKLGQLNMTRELNRSDPQRSKTDPEIMDSARLYIDQNYISAPEARQHGGGAADSFPAVHPGYRRQRGLWQHRHLQPGVPGRQKLHALPLSGDLRRLFPVAMRWARGGGKAARVVL